MVQNDDIPNPMLIQPENVKEFLLSHNINPTRQRLAIAESMFRTQQHLSAENILEQVNFNGVQVSKATVYNTLRLFVKKGMLREVVIDPLRTLFDSNVSEHHHILNVQTGEIRDIDPIEINLPNVPGLNSNEKIEGLDLVLRVTSANSQSD